MPAPQQSALAARGAHAVAAAKMQGEHGVAVEQAAAAISKANAFIRRAERVLRGSAPLEDLHALRDEAGELR